MPRSIAVTATDWESTLMRNLISLLLALLFAASASAADYKVGDLVVAIDDAHLRVRSNNRIEVTDTVFPGVTMRARAVQGRWIWVSNGVPGTSMLPWLGVFSAEQRWQIITYLRAEAKKQHEKIQTVYQ